MPEPVRRTLVPALLLLVVAACSVPAEGNGQTAAEDDEARASAAMDSVYARFTRAYALGEPDSVVALYTDRPLYLPARADEVLVGRHALREQFGFLEDVRTSGRTSRIRFESVDRGASGDVGYDIGYYHLHVEEGDGSASPASRGKFVTVWRRGADGRWRIHADGFSPAGMPGGG
jgi:ketosteroid isomerase-like protein